MTGTNSAKLVQAIEQPIGLTQFLTFRIARVHAKLNAQAAEVLSSVAGLGLMQWRILALVANGDASTSAALSRTAGIDKGQFSRTLRTMVDLGHVTVRPDRHDQRLQVLKLTAKGKALHDRVLPVMRLRQEHLLQALDPSERRAIFSALSKLEDASDARDFAP